MNAEREGLNADRFSTVASASAGANRYRRRLALWLLEADGERLYPRLPRFVQRWVYRSTRGGNA